MSDTVITTNPGSRRQLKGATFLGLEHALKAALIVVVVTLLGAAIGLAFQLWTGAAGGPGLVGLDNPGAQFVIGTAMTVAASLLVLVPALIVLELRTRAEYRKRPGFKERLAYKLPLYAACAVVLALIAASVIQLLAAFLTSLVLLGAAGADIGSIYLSQFLPALFALVLYGATAAYLFQVMKGRDRGSMFGLVVAILAVIMILALFITSAVIANEGPARGNTQSDGSIEDYFRDYNSRNDRF